MTFARSAVADPELFFASVATSRRHASPHRPPPPRRTAAKQQRSSENNSTSSRLSEVKRSAAAAAASSLSASASSSSSSSFSSSRASTAAEDSPPSTGEMPSLITWPTTHKRSSNSPQQATEPNAKTPSSAAADDGNNNNIEASTSTSSERRHQHQHQHQHQQHPGDAHHHATHSAAVTFHRGEKSFLEFHQNYAIARHLGEGSYSTVKQVTHRKKGGAFACKIVDKASLSAVDRVALGHEVRVLSSVRHPNIMQLYEVIEDDAKCYLIMELAEHGDLFDKIVKQGRFPESEAQQVVSALADALHYCHTNLIIHRDVKPENVLLSAEHGVKLCDFGFARQLSGANEQATDSCGTPGYAAPEILDGKPYGVEVDVFSLGVVTYIMLCGYPPFPMKLAQLRTHRFNVRFPSKDWAAIDSEVKQLITRMLQVKPELRPSMAEVREHAWVLRGEQLLAERRREAEARRQEAARQRKQVLADTIRRKLITSGFDVVKHGRQGLPHRTKLRLSTDGRVLSWQPKLLKRGLLRYQQNAKSLSSLFGFGSKSSRDKDASPKHRSPSPRARRTGRSSSGSGSGSNADPVDGTLCPPNATLLRLSLMDAEYGGRRSEPILHDLEDSVAAVAVLPSTSSSIVERSESYDEPPRSMRTESNSSTTSSGSASWIDRKNWWRAFRRGGGGKGNAPSAAVAAERSASGGVSFAAFSLAPQALASRVRASSATLSQHDADTSSRINNWSESPTGSRPASPSPSSLSRSSSMETPMSEPASPSSKQQQSLDASINLRDMRTVLLGADSAFFRARCGCTRCRELSIESGSPAAASSSSSSSPSSSSLDLSCVLTVVTRLRELHLEFSDADVRDAFAFLLEQATLPLDDVPSQPPAFLYRATRTCKLEDDNEEEDEEEDEHARVVDSRCGNNDCE
ncbi:hypothetical protein P43SY_004704 [Pythium insidiosum]|uniref:Protein kinase domain-containing protein n=1 Tax=Pythium insidiosum TaxID=114742 RepID=A0AAD5LAX0_PYTIN|nr:hypothetical protein P43SY_004704 [Pythium insidiosum]